MQIGTRWRVGQPAPATLPDAVVAAVNGVEADVRAAHDDADQWWWTLTWLERVPVVELDDGTIVRYDPTTNTAHVVPAEPDDSEEPAPTD